VTQVVINEGAKLLAARNSPTLATLISHAHLGGVLLNSFTKLLIVSPSNSQINPQMQNIY